MTADQKAHADCLEGCTDDGHKHKWEIEPHPYADKADILVVDEDDEARAAFVALAVQVWDECEPGEERVIKIRHNKVQND